MSQQLQAFDTVLASLQEYVYLFDLTGRFRYVNKPLLDLWGIPLEQAIGKNFFDLAYPEELATILQAQIREVIETQQPVQGATAYTSPAGAVGEYEYLFVPLLASDGSVESVAGRTQPVTERRRAEAALRASEAKYRLLFDSIDEGFCVIEVLFDDAHHPYDYRFLEVNQAFEQQTGLVNVVGRTIRELAPQHEQHWFDSYGRVALTGEPIRFEDQAQQLHRWYDVYAFRIGEPAQCQVAVLFNDITSRKQTELAQQWQEKRQAFLLQLSDRLRPLSDATEVQYQAACALGEYLGADRVGYAEDQADSETIVVTRNYTHGVASIEGRYRYDDYGPELLRAFRAGQTVVRPDIANDPALSTAEKEAHAVLQLGATVNIPLLKNGQLMAVLFMHYRQAHAWSEDELALLQETAERTWEAVVRVRAEEALRESQQRLQTAFSIQTVGVIFFDLEGGIHDANEAFQRMSGYELAAFKSGNVRWNQLTPPEFMEVTFKSQEELLTQGQNTPYEKQYIRPDGSRWWGLLSGKRLSEQECVEFVLDITQTKLAEQQLRRTNVDLDNFIYTASHDLKAPITNIEGLVHALQDHLPPESPITQEVMPLLAMMQDAVARFQRTIAHLSDVIKLQKEYNQPLERVSVATIVDDVCLDLQPFFEQTNAQLHLDLAACPTVSFSAKNLRSVVYNLLSNALKYRHPERLPQVRLTCYQQKGYTVLAVQDNGLGLDASQQAELFQMFRRFHVGIEGSGIGLYMVKRMVENAGGKLTVESELGTGSTFAVHFRH